MMNTIKSMYANNDVLIVGSKAYEKYVMSAFTVNIGTHSKCKLSFDQDDIESDDDFTDNKREVQGISLTSQTLSQLSDYNKSLELSDSENDRLYNGRSHYSQLRPLFDEIVRKIRNENDLGECVDVFEKLSFKLSANGMVQRCKEGLDVTFLGEENGRRYKEKRHKFMYERMN